MMPAEQTDINALLAAYAGREVKYGELHNHTNAGPKADGHYCLTQWKEKMAELGMGFAAIVDHKQTAHMYHKDWDRRIFLGGTEPATCILENDNMVQNGMHYNMLFADPADLEYIVETFPEYKCSICAYTDFEDDSNKHGGYKHSEYTNAEFHTWIYARFPGERFAEIANAVYERGGLLVHVHPKYDNYMISDDPLDYFYGNVMGIEIHTGCNAGYSPSYRCNEEAYQLWVNILRAGKRAYATAGSDNHRMPTAQGLTTLYASAADADAYMGYIHNGDFAPGWVGIRMVIGDAAMGGETDFSGKRLVFSVGDMYSNAHTATDVNAEGEKVYANFDPSYAPDHDYVVQLYDDSGLLMESKVENLREQTFFALDADAAAKFYRVVVWDETAQVRVGVGNPIWNTQIRK